MKLRETWVKAPFLKDAALLIVGECVKAVQKTVYEEFAEGRKVLTSCPEAENAESVAAKLASIMKCSVPREIVILTMDGSPHCFALHAALNNAIFVTGSNIPCKHVVIVAGKAVAISPETITVARYLHLVQECIRKNPEIFENLNCHSLEQTASGIKSS